ncbi:MAG: GspE/PulE family protein [Methylacidiphilales bacterium]|nr:GspE/PulE family protein [Candidatus Methylacidiphilales bacterium]
MNHKIITKIISAQKHVYMVSPIPISAIPDLARATPPSAELHVLSPSDYEQQVSVNQVTHDANGVVNLQLPTTFHIQKVFNQMVVDAIAKNTSDIHITPFRSTGKVVLRVDGQLVTLRELPKTLTVQLVVKIKMLANLDLAETRLPQDGRLQVSISDKNIDIRVSCIPTTLGERVVLRILQRSNLPSIDQLGLESQDLQSLLSIVNKPAGLVLMIGPTGSGKTTSLYGCLKHLINSQRSIFTIEDPIEYHLEGISQTQVHQKIGLTFATGLRAILRQDPDIILIGEIRDSDTAKIAVSASLTGHLVLSTIHAQSVREAIHRLIDLGVPTSLISGALLALVEQRLFRTLCQNHEPDNCKVCSATGFYGRKAMFFIAKVTAADQKLLWQYQNPNSTAMFSWENSQESLVKKSGRYITQGVTTIAEIERVISLEA